MKPNSSVLLAELKIESNVANGILAAKEIGDKQFLEFCNKNLLSDKPDIFQKLKKNKLRTFVSKKLSIKDSKARKLQ